MRWLSAVPRANVDRRYTGGAMRRTLVLIAAFCLTACAAEGRVFPLNDTASSGPMPVVSFVKQGLGRGPITVTMPDGTVLRGEYQVTENTALGFGFAGRDG